MSEYLVQIEWKDPIANAVGRLLAGVPAGVEQLDRQVPAGRCRGFVLFNAIDRSALEDVARAIHEAGADVTILGGSLA